MPNADKLNTKKNQTSKATKITMKEPATASKKTVNSTSKKKSATTKKINKDNSKKTNKIKEQSIEKKIDIKTEQLNTEKTIARNTRSAKNVKKQAKQNDDRIRKIISEQLNNISKMEQDAKRETNRIKENTLQKLPKQKNNSSTNTLNSKEDDIKKTSQIRENTILKKKEEKITVKTQKKANNKKNNELDESNLKASGTKVDFSDSKNVKKDKFDPRIVQEKIEAKKKLPKEEKNRIYKKIFINLIIACAISLYLIFVNLGFSNIELTKFAIDLKIFSIVIISVTILIFEISYKKDRGILAIFGIETFFLAIITLSLTYINEAYPGIFTKFVNYTCLLYITYYIIKSVIIYIYCKRKYRNNISDIKELVSE